MLAIFAQSADRPMLPAQLCDRQAQQVNPTLLQIRTGRVRRQNGQLTAYGKDARDGSILATALGLEGDEVGNVRVHGGPEKAIYAYAASNYILWAADHPQHAARLIPGGFGENLLIDGLDEHSACVGDRWRIGSALVEICQPRQPCATLARWFDDPRMVKEMVKNGRCGWYLRVLEEGRLQAGDALQLKHCPDNSWSIAKVATASYRSPPDRTELKELAATPGLASNWAAWAERTALSSKPTAKPL